MAGLRRAVLLAAAVVVLVAGRGVAVEAETATLRHTLSLAVDYPRTGNDEIDASLRDWLEEHVGKTLAGMAGVAISPEYKGGEDRVVVDYEASQPSARAVSFLFETMTSPQGAAHPMTRVDVISFDRETGEWLTPEDVFGDPEKALEIMSGHALAAVNEELARSRPDDYPHGLDEGSDAWFKNGFAPTAENYAALVLAPGGVRVVFQQYQVLPYAYGLPEAFFPLEELAPAKPNLALWGK